jgi:hypothetical protein
VGQIDGVRIAILGTKFPTKDEGATNAEESVNSHVANAKIQVERTNIAKNAQDDGKNLCNGDGMTRAIVTGGYLQMIQGIPLFLR